LKIKLSEWLIILLCAAGFLIATFYNPKPKTVYIDNTVCAEHAQGYVDGFDRAMRFRSYMSDEDRAHIINALDRMLGYTK
jgi:hypothetical protein